MENEEIVKELMDETEFKKELNNQIEELDEIISNMGNDNIINHSSIKEADDMIKLINKNIKAVNRRNRLIAAIRNVKIFGRFLQGGLPYIVVAGLVFTGQTLLGDVPFYPQKSDFKVAQHEQVIDQTGVIGESVSYVAQGNLAGNEIVFTTKWDQKEDGNYYRVTQTYDIGNYTTEELKEMIKNPNLDLNAVFGKSKSNKYEVKKAKDITEEDLDEKDGLKIIYHYSDDLDVILGAQDGFFNVMFSILYILITLVGSMPVLYWRLNESDYDFSEHLKRIKLENDKIDIEEIKKLFAQKKIKFEVAKREQITMEDPITGQKTKIGK